MRYLVLVRHGDYGPRRRLNIVGREQIKDLSARLKDFFDCKIQDELSIALFSSSAPRAFESAEILCAELGLDDFEKKEILWSGERVENISAVLDFLHEQENRADILILVTHLEYMSALPRAFFREFLKKDYLCLDYCPEGSALIIDCARKCVKSFQTSL